MTWRVALLKTFWIGSAVYLLGVLNVEAAESRWPSWLERAPLNTDMQFVDPSLQWGLARASRWLAYLLDLPALAGLVYAFERERADFSNFIYVFFGILVGSFVISILLSPLIGIFSFLPIVVFETFLLARFCLNSTRAALLVTLLYHVFQVAYILVYRTLAQRYS